MKDILIWALFFCSLHFLLKGVFALKSCRLPRNAILLDARISNINKLAYMIMDEFSEIELRNLNDDMKVINLSQELGVGRKNLLILFHGKKEKTLIGYKEIIVKSFILEGFFGNWLDLSTEIFNLAKSKKEMLSE